MPITETGRGTSGAWFKGPSVAGLLVFAVFAAGCAIDRSVVVGAGEQRGAVRVIDGDLDVHEGGTVSSVRVIDGDVRLHPGSRVEGNVDVTDGKLVMAPEARVTGSVEVQHVSLELNGARIDGDLDAFCVDGTLADATIGGELRIRRKAMWYVDCDNPRALTIGDGSDVARLRVDSKDAIVDVAAGAVVGQTVRPGD